jgi:uncharacterized membrane protein
VRIWLVKRWDRLRATYWFLPLVMAAGAVGLAVVAVELDREIQADGPTGTWWAYGGGPEGARALLATVAGSMITVAGVVFSITIVALSLASNQFGPRLLRNFIRDRQNQFVLGTFTATFLYCVLVLRTVRGTEDRHFVPEIAVALGLFLGLASLIVLIYFIHHVATSIQVGEVIQRVTHDLLDTIDRLWPENLGRDEPARADGPGPAGDPAIVFADRSGYVESMDADALMDLARKHDLVIRLDRRPGDFVVEGIPLASIWPAARAADAADEVNAAIDLAHRRSAFQDALFVADQLAEVAVRALSPGVNDSFTAEACIDRLGQALCRLAGRAVPSAHRHDTDGRLRVIARPVTFTDLIDSTFDRIRAHATGSPAVLSRAVEILGLVGGQVRRAEDREAVHRHLDLFHRVAERGLPDEADRAALARRYRTALAALTSAPA